MLPENENALYKELNTSENNLVLQPITFGKFGKLIIECAVSFLNQVIAEYCLIGYFAGICALHTNANVHVYQVLVGML